jgi:hypothetical protein
MDAERRSGARFLGKGPHFLHADAPRLPYRTSPIQRPWIARVEVVRVAFADLLAVLPCLLPGLLAFAAEPLLAASEPQKLVCVSVRRRRSLRGGRRLGIHPASVPFNNSSSVTVWSSMNHASVSAAVTRRS